MMRLRLIEEAIAERYPEKEMKCPVHLYIGEEAAAVGVSASLRSDDYAWSTFRGHGHYLAKGGGLNELIAELYGRSTGCSGGKGGSMHLTDSRVNFMGTSALVGGTIPLAVGSALASRIRGDDRVSISYFGDGALEEGVFHESLNFAGLHKLPVIFVCENNFWAVDSPLDERQVGEIKDKAAGYGAAVALVLNGNDVEAVASAAAAAIARARAGEGPSFIEIRTFRWHAHVEGYAETDPRVLRERAEWMARCPIATFKNRLLAASLVSPEEIRLMEQEIRAEIAAAFAFAKASPYPAADRLLADVYA